MKNKVALNKKILFIVGIALAVFLAGIFYYRYSEVRRHIFHVAFLNIGQGDSALIQFSDGETMLVDCGKDRKVLSALGRQLPFYRRTIDYVLATHPDLDHYGGCVDVLKRYQVKNIIVNGREKRYDPYWREFDAAMNREGANIIVMASPTRWTIAGDTLDFLSPDPSLALDTKADDSNNYSIVFRLLHGHKSFLFTGDMEMPLERALINRYCASSIERDSTSASILRKGVGAELRKIGVESPCPLRADVLKVGHHGSNSSSGEDFLGVVRPRQAVISVGKNNWGHPSLRVIRHLERVGAEIFRTDRVGNVIVE